MTTCGRTSPNSRTTSGSLRQIVLGLPHDDDVAAAVAFERGDDVPAEEAAAAGHEHAFR